MDLVEKMHQDFQQGNLQSLTSPLAEDVDWMVYGPEDIPYSGQFKGINGVSEFFDKVNKSERLKKMQIRRIIGDGKYVVVLGRFTFEVLATQKTFSTDFAHVFRFNDQGQINKFRGFGDTEMMTRAFH